MLILNWYKLKYILKTLVIPVISNLCPIQPYLICLQTARGSLNQLQTSKVQKVKPKKSLNLNSYVITGTCIMRWSLNWEIAPINKQLAQIKFMILPTHKFKKYRSVFPFWEFNRSNLFPWIKDILCQGWLWLIVVLE